MIYIVIGANYGDEGKGRATRYIGKKSLKNGRSVIVVKHNGGPQAGHTAHGFVHHTYGSAPCDTYLAPTFVFNPAALLKESIKYIIHYCRIPRNLYINENCIVTTPIDILMNHVIESVRSGNKHGSCGMGIYASITRNKYIPITVGKLMRANKYDRQQIVHDLIMHYSGYEHAVRFIPEKYLDLDLEKLMADFFSQFYTAIEDAFVHVVDSYGERELLRSRDDVIFETGQGLLLDKDCKESFPHVTPSHTNHINPKDIISRVWDKGKSYTDRIQFVYCTRTYLTKHGAGPCNLPPLDVELANKFKAMDKTNVPNEWQDSIRLYKLDVKNMIERTVADAEQFAACGLVHFHKISVDYFITWADMTKNLFITDDDAYRRIGDFPGICSRVLFTPYIMNMDEIESGVWER